MADAHRAPSASPRVVFLDGLPGSGKSTTAQRLCLHLQWLGRPALWYFEHELAHPLYDDEQVRLARQVGQEEPNRIWARALAGAAALTQRLAVSDETVFLEGSLLQTAVGTQLLMDVPHAEIEQHFDAVLATLAPVTPALVLFRPPDVVAALRRTAEIRGPWFPEFLVQHFRDTPRGRRTNLNDFEAVLAFFVEYRAVCDALVTRFPGPCLTLEKASADWERTMRTITDFLALPAIGAWRLPADAAACVGRFRADNGDEWTIAADERGLFLDGPGAPRLWPTPSGAWVLESVCVEFEFLREGAGRVSALRCRGALPNLALLWRKL